MYLHDFKLDLYTASQVRELDRRVAEGLGLAPGELMERAGAAAFRRLRANWPRIRRLGVVAGPGNNGGDGYVVARLAAAAGLQVRLAAPGGAPRAGSDAERASRRYAAAGGQVTAEVGHVLKHAELVVDAIFGTGLSRPPAGALAAAIEAVNACGRPCFALDLPSGLDSDTGHAPGAAVQATRTLSFIVDKPGLHTGAGVARCGTVDLADLGAPAAALQAAGEPAARLIDPAPLVATHWPPRRRDAHKGDFGHVLLIGGARGMAGAAALAATSALRSGAGLVSVATHPGHLAALLAARPELMVHEVAQATELDALLARASVLALGPGLGTGDWGRQLLRRALASRLPCVLDADALNLLATGAVKLPEGGPTIITPHPGEAARLLASDTETIAADRLAAARELQRRYGAVAVLKGAGTLVADGEGPLGVVPGGNPGMASGGMGDVLTGMIAGLWAQAAGGASAHTGAAAARLGAALHAGAGDRAAQQQGEPGLVAGDLIDPAAREFARLQRLAGRG